MKKKPSQPWPFMSPLHARQTGRETNDLPQMQRLPISKASQETVRRLVAALRSPHSKT